MQSSNTEEGSTQGSRAPIAPRGSTSAAPRGAPRATSSPAPAPRVASSTAPAPRAASSTAGAATRAASSTAARRASWNPPRQRKQPSRLKDYFYASGN